MKGEDLLLTVAVVAVIISVLAAGITYFSVASLVTRISGFATGEANLTVESAATVNFTTGAINWGSGQIDVGQTSAELNTLETGNVTNGNWTLQNEGGLRIENIGNNNVTLNISVGKTAAAFIGGTSPAYEWNFTELEAGSCYNATTCGGGAPTFFNEFYESNTTTTQVCGCFDFVANNDSIRIDLNLSIPEDSSTGALGDVLTATVVAIV